MSDLKDKYQVVMDDQYPERWFVRLTDSAGELAGLCYTYGQFSVGGADGENPTLKYETQAIHVPMGLRNKTFSEEKQAEYSILLGQILYEIIMDNINRTKVTEDGRLVLELSENEDK